MSLPGCPWRVVRRFYIASSEGIVSCVWGWTARAPGPASACLHNLVVADILRMSVSSFVSTFAALYKPLSLFGTCRQCCKVLGRPKNTW